MDQTKEIRHITIASYAHPELYPPILSAIDQLSKITSNIDVITRNTLKSQWEYPNNVKVNYVNKTAYEGFEIEKVSTLLKLSHFFQFVFKLKETIKKNKSQILIVHDVIPLFAAYLLKSTLKRRGVNLWYHNHDVSDTSKSGPYSLMGIASKYEHKAFNIIDIFSLPSKERLQYFPVEKLRNEPIIIPNFPLESFYSQAHSQKLSGDSRKVIKLVFQGSIGPGHGLEEIINILDETIHGKKLELHLVGKIRALYLNTLENLVMEKKVQAHFIYHGMQNFTKLPAMLTQFDIGIAIHKPYNVTYSTGGTASNKIYEYAACGLPILLFDNEHYRDYLEQRKWTFFTDLTRASLINGLTTIDARRYEYSNFAYQDFQNEFNFEYMFAKRLEPILQTLNLSFYSDNPKN